MVERVIWISAEGQEQELTNQVWVDVAGLRGFDMASFDYVESEILFDYGTQLKRVKTPPREMDIDLIVYGKNRGDLYQNLRRLRSMLNSYRGIGKLKVVTSDGLERFLHCVYAKGMEGELSIEMASFRKMTLTFRAFDPFFYSTSIFSNSFQMDSIPPQWFPILPLRLGSEAISGEITILNAGDIETYPIWKIIGQGENPKIKNLTTGSTISFNDVSLRQGQYITIDTKQRLIEKDDGTSLYPFLDYGSTFWKLVRGSNIIRVEMSEATPASKIEISYQERYLGA
ncbi:phage tail domain-containing protein [Thermoactinomyces sp. DSM 45892]|uniref:phage distal tail protein n=1 Tax=Thermoactinomyces sp. DSM 45892 TaxID=1882753 RepID=UPI00089A7A88|nr:phage tail domain-containing protein [Thermoactinomyces sp. DSM 45892]SDZ01074.1 Phage-related protein [Thermoactinomyces sp. DSM 45892]